MTHRLETTYTSAGLHTNFFYNLPYLPFGQVKLSLSDFHLPERKIYFPENEI